MPITGTLAIVACAAMAGVPLLNGFLSKEMFFAETVFIAVACRGSNSGCRSRRRWPASSRSSTRCASATTSSSARRRRDLPREPHEPVRWMRVPIELLVLACLVVGIVARVVDRAGARRPRRGRWSAAALPAYSLAVWHGFNAPLLMSLLAMAGGVARSTRRFASSSSAARSSAPPLIHRLDGKRAVRARAGAIDRAARGAHRGSSARGGCSRSCC